MPSPYDYNRILEGLGGDFGDALRAHIERNRQKEALRQFLSGITQEQTNITPAPSVTPPGAPPVSGVNISRQNVQIPPSDPRFINTAMQYLQSSPNAAGTLQNYLKLREMGQPTYESREIPRGGTLTTLRTPPGGGIPEEVGQIHGQPFPPTKAQATLLRTEPLTVNGVTKMVDVYGYNEGGKEVITDRKYSEFQKPGSATGEARTDRSYQFHTSQISALAKPLQDRLDRVERLKISLDQNDPQADALIAPELLTAMAGGQGSGLRMNEAEISRIVGGRNHWENLKSAALKWQTDPTKPFQITPAQRIQVRALMNEVDKRLTAKTSAITEAQRKLADSTDPMEHRRIFSDLRDKLMKEFEVGNTPTDEDIDKMTPNELRKYLGIE